METVTNCEATQINLLTGQQIAEGCAVDPSKCRAWTDRDERRWPQAARQLRVDQVLLVDQDGAAYFVERQHESTC